jgi:hypothetical protein
VIRQPLAARGAGATSGFRFRGKEISRFEGFSDAVLGFAVTLLVVSLEVPRTFPELLASMRGFAAFGICFAILVWVWFQQYLYFRRYGLEDTTSIVLNSVLLFVVLFYIYPLKFLFRLLVDQVTGGSLTVLSPAGRLEPVITAAQGPLLMQIYGLGFDTRVSIQAALLNIAVGLISLALSLVGGRSGPLSGWSYGLVGVLAAIHGTVTGKRRRALET